MGPSIALIHSPFTSAAAWGVTSDALRAHDIEVTIPEVLDDDEPPYASHFVARVAQQLQLDAPGRHLVLVGHGGAGPLLPQIAFARHAVGSPVAGYVFVDAMLPRTLKSATRLDLVGADDPVAAAELSQRLAAGHRFPEWTDGELAATVSDPSDRAMLLAGLRPRALDFFTEPLPVPEDWPDAPCTYLQLSDAYAGAAHTAQLRGWPVVKQDAHHFWPLTDPEGYATALMALLPS
ncbi:MAG: hypothetical protein LH645_12130 [Actinomycetia bacterium]|nr:hypothetical protein [Actinomycetes bacterium]